MMKKWIIFLWIIFGSVHLMNPRFPVVEGTDHADRLGMGSPHGEINTLFTVFLQEVRAKFFMGTVVRAFAVKKEVEIGENRPVFHNGNVRS